ncbi:MAG TPA: tryptophan synthase subunit alpha [Tepidisphaeraceae bacterium]|nr:tryptophan synthase subunit alpha [Tepidisphaeraceae bacterium]
MNTISKTFESLRSKRQIALMPFVPAGYPDLETTSATLQAIEQAGANIIEIGIPFSDPVADGPVIQQAFTESLAKKLKLADIFTTIGKIRPRLSVPLVAMVSYSIVFRYGVARFLTNARMSGFDGLILPDLPPPEAQQVCDQVRSAGLDTILLVAPTTSRERRIEIAKLCSGFVYYLSVSGITGERTQLPADLRDNVTQLKQASDVPVCVGFGISKPEHVKQLADVADGAIVGSALVRQMQQAASSGPSAVANAAGVYCKSLLSLVR